MYTIATVLCNILYVIVYCVHYGDYVKKIHEAYTMSQIVPMDLNQILLHCIALHCIALHCIALHCIALHCIALHCIALHCVALHCIASRRIASHRIASHRIASHRIALRYKFYANCCRSWSWCFSRQALRPTLKLTGIASWVVTRRSWNASEAGNPTV